MQIPMKFEQTYIATVHDTRTGTDIYNEELTFEVPTIAHKKALRLTKRLIMKVEIKIFISKMVLNCMRHFETLLGE